MQNKIIVPTAPNPEWRKARSWLAMKGITRKDLANGSSVVEKLEYPPWSNKNKPSNVSNNKSEKSSGSGDTLIGFGKYSTKTYTQLKEDDPRYFEWMVGNVPRFREKAAELDLID